MIRVGREKDLVELVAVSKTVDSDRVQEAINSGISSIGENKVQELEKKYAILGNQVNYHMIGHLQTNKVKNIIGKTKLIHSVDRLSLAEEINKKSIKDNITTDILLQVNIAEEETKSGLKLEEVLYFIEEILSLDNIKVRGLMTIGPNTDDKHEIRRVFKTLYNLKEDIIKRNYNKLTMEYLSMGMTGDYEIALEEGANIVRIGSAIFGKRNY